MDCWRPERKTATRKYMIQEDMNKFVCLNVFYKSALHSRDTDDDDDDE
jgi:hypothetical protein